MQQSARFKHHKHNRKRRRKLHSRPNSFCSASLALLFAIFVFIFTSPAECQNSGSQILMPQAQHPSFLVPGHNLENVHIPETQPIGSVVHQLRAIDRSSENRKITYALTGDTFLVDEESGEIRLAKQLDRERQPQIVTVVNVLGSNTDQPLESKRRVIFVDDVDDSWPVFAAHKHMLTSDSQQNQYSFKVEANENLPVGAIIISEILVTDADDGPNAEIVFECKQRKSTNFACDHFSIDARRLGTGKYTLNLRTKTLLDYEKVQEFNLVFVARGKRNSPLRGEPLESQASVHIKLINVQDEGPVFLNAPYSLSIHEGLKPNTRLLSLIVQDGDAAPQRALSMIVVPSPFSHYFQLTNNPEMSKIWYLETNRTIDRESPMISQSNSMFTIDLLAAELDKSEMPIASEIEIVAAMKEPNYAKGTLRKESVSVVVLDLPDSKPVFVHAKTGKRIQDDIWTVNVTESIRTGAPLPNLDLVAQDMDQGINSRFKLTLKDSDIGPLASNAFALEFRDVYGKAEVVLRVLNSTLLDYEDPNLRVYMFDIIASKSGPSGPLVQILSCQINIMDANDNAPRFDRDQYVIEVAENSPPGFSIATIKAHDPDSGAFGRIDYTLRGTGAARFYSTVDEGKILVSQCGVPECLDYEAQSSYSLSYEARDGGGLTSNVSVIINVIDVNDHPPRFSEYIYKRELISDNLSSKQSYISPQLIVRAKDDDGPTQGRNNITYRMKSSNLTGLEIDSSSGLVYLSQPLDLDGMISSMKSSNNNNQHLAAEKKIIFEAEVMAEDNGSPPSNSTATILLVVKGNHDGTPQFKQDSYLAYVRENQPANKPFFQVQAVDPDDKDSQLRYSLGYDLNDLVSVDPVLGELSFKSKVDYDDYKGVPYNITVYVTDNSRPYPLRASTTVSISIQDVNDKPPKFMESEYKTTLVQGKVKAGDIVLQVNAVDLDKNAQLNYSLIADDLVVSDRNGQNFRLDDIVNATGGYLSEMSRQDRVRLVGELRRLFAINKRSGSIELKSEPDYSFVAMISIPIRVADLNQEVFKQPAELQQDFAQVTFLLQTILDDSPVFAPPWTVDKRFYNITLLEELPIESPVFSLLAKDPVTNNRIDVFEKIPESDPMDYFRVEQSGLVVINRRIDYEQLAAPSKKLSFSVRAVNNETSFSVATLTVQLVDLNDNAPQFRNSSYHIAISEATEPLHEIITVTADDKDSANFGQVYYSLAGHNSELFSINPRKGSIFLKKNSKLDRETESMHTLVVTGSDCNETSRVPSALLEFQSFDIKLAHNSNSNNNNDKWGCKSSSVTVDISLIDENDNEPVFTNVNRRAEFEAIISETVSPGSVIAQATARDLDEGINGQISYEIMRADDQISRLLKVDSDGFISPIGSLSGLGRSAPYKITIRAYDHGRTSRQSYATLLLTVSDVVSNDGVPKFIRPKPDELVTLSEVAGPSTFVYQVQALDPDEEANGKLMYKFIHPSDTFEIDPFDGVIKTQNRPGLFLDRELVPNYTLIIVAQDLGSPPKQTHQILTIRIADVNDNEPYFERAIDDPPMVLYVDEEVPKDTLIGSIQAIDKDVGQNALIGYEILEGNDNNLFRLGWDLENDTKQETGNNPCRIYANGRLDRETRESYMLTLRASGMSKFKNQFMHLRDPLVGRNPLNHYNASDLSKIRVNIRLHDINDNRPTFVQQNPRSVVDSNAEIYSQLMVLKAEDADAASSEIQYSILDALYYSDSKLKSSSDNDWRSSSANHQPTSMRHVFDIDTRSGVLRNSASLRPYIDGYFEVFVKADSGLNNQMFSKDVGDILPSSQSRSSWQKEAHENRCYDSSSSGSAPNGTSGGASNLPPGSDVVESCFVAVTKAVVFITHQRETFRFVFNKTKLNDRLDEFKEKIQSALESVMFEPAQAQASMASESKKYPKNLETLPRAEKVFVNTFNTDFYERDDGSLDFSTITSCSQLVKFDDKSPSASNHYASGGGEQSLDTNMVPNQVINYDEVLHLLKSLNATQFRQQKSSSLFGQYGLLKIERCSPDRSTYRMSALERWALYYAAIMGLVSCLLAFIVSRMRKSYEKNLKLLQRSKYQYMGPYA